MGNGRIEQIGTPDEIYDEPANSFVFDFIGESVKLPVTVENGAVWVGSRQLPANGHAPKPGPAPIVRAPARFHASAKPGSAPLQGAVSSVRRVGAASFADVRLEFGQDRFLVEAAIPAGSAIRPGDRVGLTPRRYRIFEPAGVSAIAEAAEYPAHGRARPGHLASYPLHDMRSEPQYMCVSTRFVGQKLLSRNVSGGGGRFGKCAVLRTR